MFVCTVQYSAVKYSTVHRYNFEWLVNVVRSTVHSVQTTSRYVLYCTVPTTQFDPTFFNNIKSVSQVVNQFLCSIKYTYSILSYIYTYWTVQNNDLIRGTKCGWGASSINQSTNTYSVPCVFFFFFTSSFDRSHAEYVLDQSARFLHCMNILIHGNNKIVTRGQGLAGTALVLLTHSCLFFFWG